MKANKHTARNVPRRIFRLLAATGLLTAVSMVALSLQMSRDVNERVAQNIRHRIETALSDALQQSALLTEKDTAHGTGYDWIKSGDSESIVRNIGMNTTEGLLFNYSFIFDREGEVLYAFKNGSDGSDLTIEPPLDVENLLKTARSLEQSPRDSLSRLVKIEDRLGIVTLAPFRPENAPPGLASRFDAPILLNIAIVEKSGILWLPNELIFRQISVSDHSPFDSNFIEVANVDAEASFFLSWIPPNVGAQLFARSLGVIAAVCLLTSVGHIIVGRIAYKLTLAFVRESRDARVDKLTGLLNRTGIDEALESRHIQRALELNRLAIILIDMDRFKTINDTYGHAAGDRALQVMSERLQTIARPKDIVARMGGDEFMIVVIDDTPKVAAKLLVQRLAEANQVPADLGAGDDTLVQASLGFAAATGDTGMRQLMIEADRSMYDAKTAKAFLQDAGIDPNSPPTDKDAGFATKDHAPLTDPKRIAG